MSVDQNEVLNLTGFLFGNVNEEGKLEDDFLDEESRNHLPGLGHLIGGSSEHLGIAAEDNDEQNGVVLQNFEHQKSDQAKDYFNIEDALSDDSTSEEEDDDVPSTLTTTDIKTEAVDLDDAVLMPPPAQQNNTTFAKKLPIKRPLAAMVPEKYKNVDVCTFFPEFRHDKVLRFSRLFPIKSTHLPKIWKSHKRRKVKENLAPDIDVKPTFLNSEDAYVEDQTIRFLKPATADNVSDVDDSSKMEEMEKEQQADCQKGPKPTDWRWGPAQYWYDMLDLPSEVEDFDYGMKTCVNEVNSENVDESRHIIDYPDDSFLMVAQLNWEEDVIWNGDDIRNKVLSKLNSKSNAAGWVPSSFNRSFSSTPGGAAVNNPSGVLGTRPGAGSGDKLLNHEIGNKPSQFADDTFYSMFPVENEHLVYGRWEDEVIWDTENMKVKLEPRMVSMDPNDENIIFGMPEDIDPSTLTSDEPVRKVKIIQKHVKKSRMLLNRSGIISVVEEEAPPPPPKVVDKDPFNISNDEFYCAKANDSRIKIATGSTLLQHATPTVELAAPFVPTHMGPIKLRLFHRPPLKRFSHGPLANYNRFFSIHSLYRHSKKKAKARQAIREAAGGGEIFFWRNPEDVSAQDGTLCLFEYIEEHPPLMSLVGMCSKVKTYYKRKPGSKDSGAVKHNFGEVCLAHVSPFLGLMALGQSIQAIENNMYRCPIFEHKIPPTDFIVIRTRNEFMVREADALFNVGQECPLYEVPGPNSKRANNFIRDFLQVFIYRLFWKSTDVPRRIKMDEIRKAFPAHSESSIRKRLKPCAEFHRTGQDSNWWVIKSSFRLPTDEEIRSMVDPEACCAYFSMIAAEQRLRDAGYGEKFFLTQADEDDEETAIKMDDELKVAPWNTTRAYILAMKGKCLLQLTGPADPTGRAGEGFSYVRIPNKPVIKDEAEVQPKRTVTGTDADLRKLPLKDARAILRKNGVPEDEIKKLSRWEVIDVVRTLSTEKVKAGEDGDHKFSRGNRFSIAEHQERYRDDCQRIFEMQNRVLASDEVLSSEDEGESSDDDEYANDEDLDEMGKNIENMLSNKKTNLQCLRENEEIERRNLQRMIMGEEETSGGGGSNKRSEEAGGGGSINFANKVLRIVRRYENSEGKIYSRTEIVRKLSVMEFYIKIRQTKDDQFIRRFALLDESAKDEMKREKRRIQEQLRRIKRNQDKSLNGQLRSSGSPNKGSVRYQRKMKPDLKLRCGACGEKGHMRTNKACPKFVYSMDDDGTGMGPVAMTEEDERQKLEQELERVEMTEQLINCDGIKMVVNAKVVKHVDEIRRRSMILKVPKQAVKPGTAAKKRVRVGSVEHCDYLTDTRYKPVKRIRTDPVVTLATFLENVHSQLRVMDEALQFLQPVSSKKVMDYLNIVKTPMDLQTIRENIHKKKYHSREDFLADISQIVENSAAYNGASSIFTINAKRLLEKVVEKFSENESKLIRIEKMINPLLDDDDQVALTYILNSIMNEKIKGMQDSWPFLKPVSKKNVKGYYESIKVPMDLETISNKVTKHKYHNRYEFLRDLELIYTNSYQFNSDSSEFTLKAKRLLEATKEIIESYSDHLSVLEEKIAESQAKALEADEADSIGAASLGDDFEPQVSLRGKRSVVARGDVEEGVEGKVRRKYNRKKQLRSKASADDGSTTIESGNENSETTSGFLLGDDLQYSSDEDELQEEQECDDGDEEDEAGDEEIIEDDEMFEEVEESFGNNQNSPRSSQALTVTVASEEMGGTIVDFDGSSATNELNGGSSVIDLSGATVIGYLQEEAPEEEQGQTTENGQQIVFQTVPVMDEQVDEDYDPTDFLQNLPMSHSKSANEDSTENVAIDRDDGNDAGLHDDLDLTDSEDEEEDVTENVTPAGPEDEKPTQDESSLPEEDGIWF